MRDIASWVQSFAGRPAALVRVVKFEGFGGRREGEAMIIAAGGGRAGSLLSGAADAAIAGLDIDRAVVVSVPVGDDAAVASGLACGGTARLLVQPLASISADAWTLIADREPFVLVSRLDGESVGESVVVGPGTDGSADGVDGPGSVWPVELRDTALSHLQTGRSATVSVESSVGLLHLETVSPPPHAVVIGTAELAGAIERQGALLGWSCATVDERGEGGLERSTHAAASLGPVDALIVLSHDLPASCAALATALRGRCGYVGALGSRHTQAARRERLLTVEQLGEAAAQRVHGPIGLDLGSRTPEETALAIFAEILAARGGRTASSLSATTTPIH